MRSSFTRRMNLLQSRGESGNYITPLRTSESPRSGGRYRSRSGPRRDRASLVRRRSPLYLAFAAYARASAMSNTHRSKLLIIGSGPAGYTAAIYAARANLQPILVQGLQPGGQMTITTDVENYPGFADVIQGPWLMEQMQAQAEHVGTRIFSDTITSVDLARRPFEAEGDSGDSYVGEALDHRHRRAGALARACRASRSSAAPASRPAPPATASSSAARKSAVVGGGNTAVEEAIYPDPPRDQGDADPSPRQLPRREDHAGPPVRQSEDRGDLGQRRRGGAGRRRARRRQRR